MPSFSERLQHAWNAFLSRDNDTTSFNRSEGMVYSYRPDRPRFSRGNERSIVTSIYNQIAMDCAAIRIEHVKLDENGRYLETVNDGLNKTFNVEANLDQTGRELRQDIFMSLFDEGVIAVVPTETTISPIASGSYDVLSCRVGKILEWRPSEVKVRLYDERDGKRKELILPKRMVVIVQNPLYAVMNEPNSTLQRLKHKIALLDAADEQSVSGRLDLIVQVPYTIKHENQQKYASKRRKDIEMQLATSKYGIAYVDGTEHVTQLNRPVENNLVPQIESLTRTLYSQLGMSENIFNGTATEEEQLNYYNRTIEPLLSALADEMERKFLTKTARSQGQAIRFFKDSFRLVPTAQIAEIADKFTRNEILSPNEVRAIIGYRPSSDPKADELRNRNLNEGNEAPDPAKAPGAETQKEGNSK